MVPKQGGANMRIMAVDLGDARTGLACSDALEMLASPVGVLHEKNFDVLVEKVAAEAKAQGAEILVIGYPKNMDNTIGERAEKSERFVEEVKGLLSIPVVLWDERSTTVSAIGYLNKTNTRGQKRKNVVDAVAATIILENYLNWRGGNSAKIDPQQRG